MHYFETKEHILEASTLCIKCKIFSFDHHHNEVTIGELELRINKN